MSEQETTHSPLDVHSAAERILAAGAEPVEEPIEEPVPQETQETETDPPESEPSEEVEAPIEASEEEKEEETPPDETSQFISDLNEWIKDGNDFDSILIPTKVNGVEGEATLADILQTHRIGQASEERLNELKTQKQQFDAEKQDQLSQVTTQLEQAKGLAQMLEQQFLAEYEQVNWTELRETDPAEFSARRQDFIERQGQIQQAREHITTTQQTQMQEAYKEHLGKEQARLHTVIPEWAEEAVAKQEKMELRDYLMSLGIPIEQIDGKVDANGNIIHPGLSDASAIAIARKAMLYDKGQKKVETAQKKVKKLPKVVKPGKAAAKDDLDVEKAKAKRGKLKKSGRPEDAASLFFDMLNGGQ